MDFSKTRNASACLQSLLSTSCLPLSNHGVGKREVGKLRWR